jgi:3-methylcrotonyl-CoA carboxylase alpha subunit
VEVQVFGDTHGNVVSIFERDCSVQRRHQKVIEEAPAPQLSTELRAALGEAGRTAANAVNYTGAGTVEFLVDRDGGFHFMEMNTRLQVEHPVTEMITGLDLVEWQIRVAAGEPLPLAQDQIAVHGHAIEARVYAEDTEHDFRPSIGKIVHLRAPRASEHVRVDTGIEQGDTITPFYDPMIAKLIVWDETRELAVGRMAQALGEFQIAGVANNVEFLQRLITSPSFTETRLDTSIIEREQAWIHARDSGAKQDALLVAALAIVLRESAGSQAESGAATPWDARDGWRLNSALRRTIAFTRGEERIAITVEYGAGGYGMSAGGRSVEVNGTLAGEHDVDARIGGRPIRTTVVVSGAHYHVFLGGDHFVFDYDDPLDVEAQHHAGEGSLLAPMPGRVVALAAEPGQQVEKGAPLMILEAMKMECTIHAPATGSVRAFYFAAGDQVTEGAELLDFARDDENGNADG